MEMNRTRIAMCAIAAVAAVATVAVGATIYFETDERDELLERLEGQRSRRNRNAGADKTVAEAAKANEEKTAAWAKAAYAAAEAAGARPADTAVNPVAFKSLMVEQAREFAKLPGTAEGTGRIVKDEFGFGFDAFVKASAIPQPGELPRLQRQWYDVMRFLRMAAAAGVGEILSVSAAGTPSPAEPQTRRRGGSRKEQADPYPAIEEKYVFKFNARPAALVKLVNALTADGRFYAIDTMSFEQEGDPLAAMLGAGLDTEPAGGRRGRRRRGARRGAENEEAKEGEDGDTPAKKGLVTDPASCAPFTVTFAVSTLEFTGAPAKGDTEAGK